MNYIYDVLADFSEELYDFFDWNVEDNISHIRKIPLFKINTVQLHEICTNQVIFSKEFLEKIYQKTEIFTNRSVKTIPYACLLSDGSYVVAIQLRKEKILEKSHLLLEEELEVIDTCGKLKEQTLSYQIVRSKERDPFRTRKQMDMETYLKKELRKLEREADQGKISYLYYECFNEKEENQAEIFQKIQRSLEEDFDTISKKLYSFFKLLQVKK